MPRQTTHSGGVQLSTASGHTSSLLHVLLPYSSSTERVVIVYSMSLSSSMHIGCVGKREIRDFGKNNGKYQFQPKPPSERYFVCLPASSPGTFRCKKERAKAFHAA